MTCEASAQAIIQLPRDEAWEKLRDISLAHHYVPGIVATEIVTEQKEGVGASRYVYRSPKSYLQETVVEWTPGEGFLIKLHKGDKPAPPFKQASFRYLLSDATSGATLFTPTLRYELPGGAIGRWLEQRMRGFVSKTMADVAIAMKLYYETGKPTTADAIKAFKASTP
ncbi:MAG: SRPBCC family protein [Pseudomonadota bacterium]